MTRSADSSPALVVLIEPTAHQHHAGTLLRAGFRVISVPADAATVSRVLGPKASVVAAELNPIRPTATFAFAQEFRADPQTRLIPFVANETTSAPTTSTLPRGQAHCGCNWNPQTARGWSRQCEGFLAAADQETPGPPHLDQSPE